MRRACEARDGPPDPRGNRFRPSDRDPNRGNKHHGCGHGRHLPEPLSAVEFWRLFSEGLDLGNLRGGPTVAKSAQQDLQPLNLRVGLAGTVPQIIVLHGLFLFRLNLLPPRPRLGSP